MNKTWFEGKELAVAFAILGGIFAYWWYESAVWILLTVVAGALLGYLLQKQG